MKGGNSLSSHCLAPLHNPVLSAKRKTLQSSYTKAQLPLIYFIHVPLPVAVDINFRKQLQTTGRSLDVVEIVHVIDHAQQRVALARFQLAATVHVKNVEAQLGD